MSPHERLNPPLSGRPPYWQPRVLGYPSKQHTYDLTLKLIMCIIDSVIAIIVSCYDVILCMVSYRVVLRRAPPRRVV